MENGALVNNVANLGVAAGPQIHIRVEGRSYDIPLRELDIGDHSTDEQVRTAAAEHIGVPIGKLRGFHIDRNAATGDMQMTPPAVFG